MRFERQEYQEDCVSNILGALSRDDEQPLCLNVNQDALADIQKKIRLPVAKQKQENTPHLDIVMETGTGKTFTYIKTMHEMRKKFGTSKFVIFVPRIAIRAGIIQNIKLTDAYFSNEYKCHLKWHTYGGEGDISQVRNFIRNEDEFSVLILTTSSITAKNKHTRILTRSDESLFGSQSPLDAISKLNPVVIFDEPHLLTGTGFVDQYNDYFAECLRLRFGATFPENDDQAPANVVYNLDSLTAFNDGLVKKIAVTTIIDGNASLKFTRSGDKNFPLILHYFKDGIEASKTIRFQQNLSEVTGDSVYNFHVTRCRGQFVYLSDGRQVKLADTNYTLNDDTIRDMIKQTIGRHFEKEEDLFKQGIKTLSLFFIPKVDDFRGDNPRIKRIFEEEYRQIRQAKLGETKLDAGYRAYLTKDYDGDQNLLVHEGYFSGDKGTNEEKIGKGVDIILNDKTRLLSLNESLRFVFSVWALQEGWDNPNIFTLCKLAPTDKDTKRRQQVGRGLRLAVNQDGKRQTIDYHKGNEDVFYDINTLDVVVSGHEVKFIEGIQSEIVGDSLTATQFTRAAMADLVGVPLFEDLIHHLRINGVIALDENNVEVYIVKQPVAEYVETHRDQLPDTLKPHADKVIKAFTNLPKSVQVLNRNKKTNKVGIRKEQFAEFEALWHTITKQAEIVYKDVDAKKVIAEVKARLAEKPIQSVSRRVVKQTYDHKNNTVVTNFDKKLGVVDYKDFTIHAFIDQLMNRLKLPFGFYIDLCNAIGIDKIKSNPGEAHKRLIDAVQGAIHNNVVQNIGYNFNGKISVSPVRQAFYEDDACKKPATEIEAHKLGRYKNDTQPSQLYLFEEAVFDSQIEANIIDDAPEKVDDDKVIVFAKLPRITIPTPYKSYSPDFAYYVKTKGEGELFLVVEAKGYDDAKDIPCDEKRKMDYGEKFFQHLAKETGKRVYFRKRINQQGLAEILREIRGQPA